jgi:coenzyme F420 hydrogenase subunit delta
MKVSVPIGLAPHFPLAKTGETVAWCHIMHISHNVQIDSPLHLVILGCGNILFGDDGFGPAVIERLERTGLPKTVQAIDVGTSIREHLLDYLLAPRLRPRRLMVVDATYREGADPGTLFCCQPGDLPPCKVHDFSLHQFPTVNLLAELQTEIGTRVELLLAQAATLPEEIAPGLSPAMDAAVGKACELILQRINQDVTFFSTGIAGAATESVS